MTPCSNVSIVNFEQVNAARDANIIVFSWILCTLTGLFDLPDIELLEKVKNGIVSMTSMDISPGKQRAEEILFYLTSSPLYCWFFKIYGEFTKRLFVNIQIMLKRKPRMPEKAVQSCPG